MTCRGPCDEEDVRERMGEQEEKSLEERESFIFSFPSLIIFVEKKQKDGEKEIERLQSLREETDTRISEYKKDAFEFRKGIQNI